MRVRAKRRGWDDPKDGIVTETDILDPAEGPVWVEGELHVFNFLGNEYVEPYKAYMVGNVSVDKETIEEL